MKTFLLSLNIFGALQKRFANADNLAGKALLSVIALYLINALWEGFKQNLSGLDIDTEFITITLRSKASYASNWFKQLFHARMEEKGCYQNGQPVLCTGLN